MGEYSCEAWDRRRRCAGTIAINGIVPFGLQAMTCDVHLQATEGTPAELRQKLQVAAAQRCVVQHTLK